MKLVSTHKCVSWKEELFDLLTAENYNLQDELSVSETSHQGAELVDAAASGLIDGSDRPV